MRHNFDLCSGWLLKDFPLERGIDIGEALGSPDGWTAVTLPCDVTAAMVETGRAEEPTVADNAERNLWIERRSWWFRREFSSDELIGWREADAVELYFGMLDLAAEIYLNGTMVGNHCSCHYEFRQDIKRHIAEGKNLLVVRLSVGTESVSEAEIADMNYACCVETRYSPDKRGDMRRMYLRKPQYCFGWDWSPRAATCGITGNAGIEMHRTIAVRELSIRTSGITAEEAIVTGEAAIENFAPVSTCDADMTVRLSLAGAPATELTLADIQLGPGLNYIPFELKVPDPKMWWPNGMGAQPLYDVELFAVCGDATARWPAIRIGLRTIELDCGRGSDGLRRFAFRVNGAEIFMKGANWIPPDMLYARADSSRIGRLIDEARNANFNVLRVWGGAVYPADCFFEKCDENGILVWQDFMFACSSYPDHLDSFSELCAREMDYQTKRLRNHASLALFCGGNENYELSDWGVLKKENIRPGKRYGLDLVNTLARRIIHANCPHIPYWSNSPAGGERPQSPDSGDVHYWSEATMSSDMSRRTDPFVYDETTARFVSEYGYCGPARLETIRDYHGGTVIERGSRIWDMHMNTVASGMIEAGISRQYTESELSLEEYVLYGGLMKGIVLGYSLEAFRAKPFCAGGIFWMYNDCWGENGWTIVDYYLRRNIAYYAVAHAFRPVKLILRRTGGRVVITGVNETADPVEFDAELGVISYSGDERSTETIHLTLPARSRGEVFSMPLPDYDPAVACVAVIPRSCAVEPETLRVQEMKKCRINGSVTMLSDTASGPDRVLVLRAESYSHAVHFDADCRFSDNYFDMLPGQVKTVTAFCAENLELGVRWTM